MTETLVGTCLCGAAGWELDGDPGPITACNCTACRRNAGLWAYDYEGERIRITGRTSAFVRTDLEPYLENHFCSVCANLVAWRGLQPGKDGRRRAAVNVRLAPPAAVAHLAIKLFDGIDTFEDLPQDGRRVRDMWV